MDYLEPKVEVFDENEDENPWEVSSLYTYLFFCCPECDSRVQDKQQFSDHCFQSHPRVSSKKVLGRKPYWLVKKLRILKLIFVLTIYITVFVTRGRHFGARESV
jgi:hypothetical protein